jgi:acetyl esterase/lipase
LPIIPIPYILNENYETKNLEGLGFMVERISLEKAAIEFSEANAPHPRIYELPIVEGRKLLDDVQNIPVHKEDAELEDVEFDAGVWGKLNVRFVRPKHQSGKLPVILYLHGAGWVFGNAHTHDKLIRELSVKTNSVVVFPEYALSPEAKYPTAIEQNYAVFQALSQFAEEKQLNVEDVTVAGDSVGGNMATVMTIMAKQRSGKQAQRQVLYYPVTDANFDTESYKEFAENYFLTLEGMQWFWDQYTTDENERAAITASPLRATKEELAELPEALILTGEADVLRDEGEAYARKLRDAGVGVTQVRFQGMVHDFVMVNLLDETKAARAAMSFSTEWISAQR